MKPRLTEKVIRGLMDCVNLIQAGDPDDMEANGDIGSADDVEAAERWLRAMVRHRDEARSAPTGEP